MVFHMCSEIGTNKKLPDLNKNIRFPVQVEFQINNK